MIFDQFCETLNKENIIEYLRNGLIGEGMNFQTPFGCKKLIYADYTASGRSLLQVENFITEHVLPYYANSHTQASYCGGYITQLREEARSIISDAANAGDDCSVIFSGSGATSGVNRFVAICGIAELCRVAAQDKSARLPVVFVGPYEHHSNILPWRESGAEVIEIEEADDGGPDLQILEEQIMKFADRPLLIGAFSAASNVTGILCDVNAITRLLKSHGAIAFWDYACGAPYIPINMNPGAGLEIDAMVVSPHKFPGGPGSSGLLIVRNSVAVTKKPTWPGGGSVSYVSPWAHDYYDSLIEREEAGTPNIIGDIRAALVFLVKEAVGTDFIKSRDEELLRLAQRSWNQNSKIELLGKDNISRLPIFSFAVRNDSGGYLHHQLFTRMLSDLTGIQARGGCVCAGPYGHRLLGVNRQTSQKIRHAINAGQEVEKPGWIRLNFSYLMDDATANEVISGVNMVANEAMNYSKEYQCNCMNAEFQHNSLVEQISA